MTTTAGIPRTPETSLRERESLRTGEHTSRDLTQHALRRIATHEALGSFVSVNPQSALRAADEADRAISATPQHLRHTLPPLLGVPSAHKDLVSVIGSVTSHGSLTAAPTRATTDDPVAAAVREAGAVTLGKTQVPEFGIAAYSENLVAPPARNPHDLTRSAGGSSGGSAAAIAAGLISGGIGSDGGGSLRIPAAACGIVGLKPTRARIAADRARTTPNPYHAPALVTSGPLAQNPTDAALWFDALRGDRSESSVTAVHNAATMTGLSIARSTASPFENWINVRYAPAVLAALDVAERTLSQHGHRVSSKKFTYSEAYPEAFTSVWTQSLAHFSEDSEQFNSLGKLAQWFAHSAQQRSEAERFHAAETLNACAQHTLAQWSQFDVILTPTIAFAPPLIGEFTRRDPLSDYQLQCQWAPITSVVNVVGLPAISVPVARTRDGWPVSVQLIGQPRTEAQLLQLAEQLMLRPEHNILQEAYL